MPHINGSVPPPQVLTSGPSILRLFAVVTVENVDVSGEGDPRIGSTVGGVDRVKIEALGSGSTAAAAVDAAVSNATTLAQRRATQFEAATRQSLGCSNITVTFDFEGAVSTAQVAGDPELVHPPFFAANEREGFDSLEKTQLGEVTWFARPYTSRKSSTRDIMIPGVDDGWD